MKILVMSDSHGWDCNAAEAVRRTRPFDALMHLGDVQESEKEFRKYAGVTEPAFFAEGNCDLPGRFPARQEITAAGHRIFLTHGHAYAVSTGIEDLREAAREHRCGIALFGHTHRPLLDDSDPSVLVLNPGSITNPRQEDHRPSYMILQLEEGMPPKVTLKYL